MQNQKQKLSFNTIPHFIASDFRNKKMGVNELFLFLWLRTIANPYGIVTTSLDALRDDLFPKLKINTVNVVLLLLREKQYVYFKKRQGKRGSFEIHLGDWLLPNKGGYKTLDKFFGNVISSGGMESEATQNLGSMSQKFDYGKSELSKRFSFNREESQITPDYNDNETETDKDNDDNTLANKGRTKTAEFNPRNSGEARCKEIAIAVGDECINPLLSVYRKHGLNVIETAYGIFREDMMDGKEIRTSKPAYLFGIIKKKLADDG